MGKVNTVCIVGHGTSLKGARLGKAIDACDKVVRLKNCHMLLAEPHDYGKRTDAMCSSTEVLPYLEKVKCEEYWGYPKKGSWNKATTNRFFRRMKKEVMVPIDVCNLWNCFFQELGAKHPNVSTGVAALIIAMDRWRPEIVYLAGFDNVLNPSLPKYHATVPTPFNGNGTHDTGHDWAKEKELLPYLCSHFSCKILDLKQAERKVA